MEDNDIVKKIEDISNGMASVARVQGELIKELKELVEELRKIYARYEDN